MKVLIAESKEVAPAALARLRGSAEVIEADLDREALLASVSDADVLWIRLRNRIDREVMDAAARLRIIVTNTTGIDHIDMEEAARRQITVLSLRGEAAFLNRIRGTAELAVGLVLALVRHLPAATLHVREGGWDRYPFKGHELFEKTAGIVGYGRLGRIVAGYLGAFGMRVLAATKNMRDCHVEPGVSLVPLERLLAEADVVSLHVDLNPDTRGMFGEKQFAAMKPGSWFINTARGELVDEPALLQALETGKLAGAALDVVADRYAPVSSRSPLFEYASTHDNLIITPHIGGYTFESLAKTEIFLADKLVAMLRGRAAEVAG